MTQELAVLPPAQPSELVRQTTDIAGLCKDVVVRTAKNIGGRNFVPVEGWMTIATAHGCIVTIISVEKMEGGILAVAELRRASDAFAMSRAEGFVGDDEETWAKRPEYARRAMAQTRAMSRVCRTAFAHVVVMMNAGLETTPMEEVPHGGFDNDAGRLTDDPVPSTYWDMKKKSGMEAANAWLSRSYDGAKAGVRKTDDGWNVVIYGESVAHEKRLQASDAPIDSTHRQPKSGVTDGELTGWRDAICTFGKKNGPLRGKKLGELNDDSLKYLADIFLAEGKDVKPGDKKMVAGLALWQAEGNRKISQPENESQAMQFNGKNHEDLYDQLVWAAIKPDDFIAAMKEAKAIPENAKSFINMSDETAKSFLEDFDNAEQHVKQYLEKKAA